MINKSDVIIKKLAELRKNVNDKINNAPDHLKQKDKRKLSKIRNNIKQNSKK